MPPYSFAAHLPCSMELASYCSEDSFRSRIRRLCRSLVTSKSPQIHTLFHWKTSLKASCDMKNPVESSISQLEKRFWEHLLRYGRDASVVYESLEEKIEMTSVDLCLLYGAAVADRFIALLGQLMLTPNGEFLLQSGEMNHQILLIAFSAIIAMRILW